jgi:hypothetical protein
MEIVLNLAWMLLAVVSVLLWMRYAPRVGANRRTQIAALAMLILILFPVISVTDDLQVALTVAEDDAYLRRNFAAGGPHSDFPAAAVGMLPQTLFTEVSLVYLRMKAPGHLPAPVVNKPALTVVQNRPPPSA